MDDPRKRLTTAFLAVGLFGGLGGAGRVALAVVLLAGGGDACTAFGFLVDGVFFVLFGGLAALARDPVSVLWVRRLALLGALDAAGWTLVAFGLGTIALGTTAHPGGVLGGLAPWTWPLYASAGWSACTVGACVAAFARTAEPPVAQWIAYGRAFGSRDPDR